MDKYGIRFLIVGVIFLFGKNGMAQTMITGKVSDEKNKIAIEGVEVFLFKKEDAIRKTITDINGNFSLKVDPGIYEMEFSKRGFPSERLIEIIVIEGQSTAIDFQLLSDKHICGLIIQMRIPLINFDKMEKGQVFLKKSLKTNSHRNIRETIKMTSGVTFGQ